MHHHSTQKSPTPSRAAANRGMASAVQRKDAANGANQANVIQCAIGLGGILNHGKLAFGPSGKRYVILSSMELFGKLQYKLSDEGGNELYVAFDDDGYRLDTEYKGVMGFTGLDNPHEEAMDFDLENDVTKERKTVYALISFRIVRRDESARTNTTFASPQNAVLVLMRDCKLSVDLANSLISKQDWSYPTLQQLVILLQQNGELQPGLSIGQSLWTRQQPAKDYSITTSPDCNPLAQIVGCHLMEYQETNNGTQGPRQQRDQSRKKQLGFSQAILELPSEQAASHTLGIGMPQHARLFPAMFDVKFEDSENKTFLKTAGSVTYKAFQSSLKERNQTFDFKSTLQDEARKDRRDQTKKALSSTVFKANEMDKFNDEEFLQHQFGIKDTESDNSQEEDEGWEFPYNQEDISGWKLDEFHQFVFKHNVYSGVMLKEYSAKLAELDIKEQSAEASIEREKIEESRTRRKGVQNRIIETNDMLQAIMESLEINVNLVYRRISEWKKAWTDNAGSSSTRKEKLQAYIKMTLAELKHLGYPTVAKYLNG